MCHASHQTLMQIIKKKENTGIYNNEILKWDIETNGFF